MAYTYAGQFGPEAVIATVSGATVTVPNATVTVYEADGTTKSTLYTDRTKTTTAANPTTTDSAGNLTFYTNPGLHVVTIVGDGVTKTVTLSVDADPAEMTANGVPAVGNAGGATAAPLWASVNDGSPATPSTTESYLTPVLYIERHTNSNVAAAATWGNSYKTAAALIEVVGYGSETGEVNGLAARVQSTGVNPVTGAGNVAISSVAESVTASGRNRDCWGACFVAQVSGAGTPPTNLVGVEVDLVPNVQLTSTVRPGQTGYQNYTGMMIQSASQSNYSANTGLWITTVLPATSAAYQFGIVAEAGFKQWGAYIRNSLNVDGAGGVYIETQWGTASTKLLSCFVTGGSEQLRLTGDGTNPFWFRIGGALKQMVQQITVGTTTGFTAGAGTAMNSASTSTGGAGTAAYTFGDVVLALKTLGLVAT